MRVTGMRVRSIRTKLLALVMGVSLVVGGVSTLYDVISSQALLGDQLSKRGRYIASNLAYNSKYGVLTEDKPLLNQLLEGAMSAAEGTRSDVAGAMIRDAKGGVLAHKGSVVRDLPSTPASAPVENEAVTDRGDRVLLFRAPVETTASGAGGALAAELGIPPSAGSSNEEQKGGVEVILDMSVMAEQQRRLFLQTTIVGFLLIGFGGIAGFYLIGRWFRPV